MLAAVPACDQERGGAATPGRLDVAGLVADHKGLRERKTKFQGRALQQAGPRFSATIFIFRSVRAHVFFFFSSRRRHTRSLRDWSSDVSLPISMSLGVLASASPVGILAGDVTTRLI